MNHVKRGCLTRTDDNIPSDGSRIEGSHKGWNSIMRTFASGLGVFHALGHDFVLRRNIRIASATSNPNPFVLSTHSSHHIHLVSRVASLWNLLLEREGHHDRNSVLGLKAQPMLEDVQSGETFGIVKSAHSITYAGLLDIKEEDSETDPGLPGLLDMVNCDIDTAAVNQALQIDPGLFLIPQSKHPLPVPDSNGHGRISKQAKRRRSLNTEAVSTCCTCCRVSYHGTSTHQNTISTALKDQPYQAACLRMQTWGRRRRNVRPSWREK